MNNSNCQKLSCYCRANQIRFTMSINGGIKGGRKSNQNEWNKETKIPFTMTSILTRNTNAGKMCRFLF